MYCRTPTNKCFCWSKVNLLWLLESHLLSPPSDCFNFWSSFECSCCFCLAKLDAHSKFLSGRKIISKYFLLSYVVSKILWSPLKDLHLFKDNDRITRKRCKICSKLTIKTPERRQWRHSTLRIFPFYVSPFLIFLL